MRDVYAGGGYEFDAQQVYDDAMNQADIYEETQEDASPAQELVDYIGETFGYGWVLALIGFGVLLIVRKRVKKWIREVIKE